MSKVGLKKLAKELEGRGFVVIRAHEHHTPDLIAIPSEHANVIQVISIVAGDEPTYMQSTTLEALRVKGLQVEFHYPEIRQVRTHAEVLASESDYQDIGGQAFINCLPIDNPFKRRSVEWYRFRANWEIGFKEMEKIHRMLAKGPKPEQPK